MYIDISIYVHAPPPRHPPFFGQKTFFIETPSGMGFDPPPSLCTSPTPQEGIFRGWGGGGVKDLATQIIPGVRTGFSLQKWVLVLR